MTQFSRLALFLFLAAVLAVASDAHAQAGPAEWDEMNPRALARELARYVDSGNTSQVDALADYMEARFETEAGDDALTHQWVYYAQAIQGSLTDAEKAAWVGRIRAHLPEGGEALKNHSVQDLYTSVQMQLEFGNTEAAGLWLDWWGTEPAWQDQSLVGLSFVASGLAIAGAEAETPLDTIANHVVTTYLQDANVAQEVGGRDWHRMGKAIRGYIPAQTRIDTRETLTNSALEGIGERTLGQVYSLNAARSSVLGVEEARAMYADWVVAGNPVTKLSVNLWSYVMKVLATRGPSTIAARQAIAGQILAQLQADATSYGELMSGAGRAHWREINQAFRGELPEPQLTATRTAVTTAVTTQLPLGMPMNDALRVEDLMQFLGEEESSFLVTWAGTDESWKQYDIKRLRVLARHFGRTGEDGAAHRQALADIIVQKYLAEPRKFQEGSVSDWRWTTSELDAELNLDQRAQIASAVETQVMANVASPTLRDAVDMGQLWQWADDDEKFRSRTLQAYNITVGTAEARQQVTAENLTETSIVLIEAGLVDAETAYEELAQAVVAAEESGVLDTLQRFQLERLGQCLGAPEARRIVYTAAVNGQSPIDPELAHVLTHAYRATGGLDQWLELIEQKVEASEEDGDAQAHWLIAEAIAQAEVPRLRRPIRGFASLEQALGVAASDATKVIAAEQLADYFDETRSWEAGVTYLESIEDQFATDAGLAAIDALKAELDNAGKEAARKNRR